MKFVGWVILIFNFMLNATGDHWQNYAGMLLGACVIALGYWLDGCGGRSR
jgi:hypothetical protein